MGCCDRCAYRRRADRRRAAISIGTVAVPIAPAGAVATVLAIATAVAVAVTGPGAATVRDPAARPYSGYTAMINNHFRDETVVYSHGRT
jgi:hypothetical protein